MTFVLTSATRKGKKGNPCGLYSFHFIIPEGFGFLGFKPAVEPQTIPPQNLTPPPLTESAANPTTPPAPTRMSTSESKLQASESNAAASKTLEDQAPIGSNIVQEEKNSAESGKIPESGGDDEGGEDLAEEEEEEEGECGFCLFMKGGGCRDSFMDWEKCIEEAEKNKEDIVEKCFEVTGALKKCMEAHADYYAPILKAEKVAEEEAIIELEKELASNATQQNTNSRGPEVNVGSENSEEQKASAGGK